MANSLRAKLSKLRHDGHISESEYQAFCKKLDGHDKQIRNETIDGFVKEMESLSDTIKTIRNEDAFFTIETIRNLASELKSKI